TAGPAVLAVETSPLVVRADLSAPLDPGTVNVDPFSGSANVQLTFNPTGHFGDENDQPVYLAGFHFSTNAAELQLKPAATLAPGVYRLLLVGDPGDGSVPVLMDATDTLNLGQNATHTGQNFTFDFQIAAGQQEPGDTAVGARDLGDVTASGRVRVTGAIG